MLLLNMCHSNFVLIKLLWGAAVELNFTGDDIRYGDLYSTVSPLMFVLVDRGQEALHSDVPNQ